MPVNDEPPLLAIAVAETHYTAELIKETGEFVVNVPNEELLKSLMICGKVSGRKENKFKKAKLTPVTGKKVKAPLIKECIGYLECRVVDAVTYDGVVVFVGSVLACGARKELYDGYWITEKAKTVHHLGSSFFALTGKRFKV